MAAKRPRQDPPTTNDGPPAKRLFRDRESEPRKPPPPLTRTATRRQQRQRAAQARRAATSRAADPAANDDAKPEAVPTVATASWTAAVEGTPGRLLARSRIFHGRPVLARSHLPVARNLPRVIFGLPHQRACPRRLGGPPPRA